MEKGHGESAERSVSGPRGKLHDVASSQSVEDEQH
jgi:hypothetical protein